MARADFQALEKFLPSEEHRANLRSLLAYNETLTDHDEILRVIQAMGLFSSIAQTIPEQIASDLQAQETAIKALLDRLCGQLGGEIAELKKELLAAKSIPEAIKLAAAEVDINTDGISKAAKNIDGVTGRIWITFMSLSAVFGGAATVIVGKFWLHWL